DTPPLLQSVFMNSPVFGGQVKNVVNEVTKRQKQGDRVLMISRQANRLSNLFRDQADFIVTPIDSLNAGMPPPNSGSVTLINSVLMEGWALKHDQTVITVLTDSEIFGWKKPTTTRRRKPRKGITPETFFADVNPGDLVVHIEHGIGCYVGLVKIELDGTIREYLAVEYAKSDKLYVPIHQADRLARYVGVEDKGPGLTRLGSADWNTVKRRAKKAIKDLAQDLLKLYAQREVVPGRAFAADSEWQTELEDTFSFVETDDQLQAINDVKADMEKTRPMDRLVCGDVGYGKTEVALRAAFKAVLDGTQVAILVPTTVLAQQHYQTFIDRLRNYPVEIEMLSRFRTKKQQEQTLLKLAMGTVDIVIGTHRLIQKDVVFKNLGLLVIDEEQRFGVTHKEKLKDMRANAVTGKSVDALTLTATPIPRTLHMSLSGMRDLSIISTPPEERLPIHTTVAEYDEILIKTAISRELARGGQVFYVFNRVMGIEQKANRIRSLLPDAKVSVGHGQMSERKLERVMVDFVSGENDVLVCTTIVESGLDLPNVNTIIIDRADKMGLAQLYQLRGRVGRGARQAYAYLLTAKHHKLKQDAYKRLEAITEANELGAGFQIAMRDLEIRGAGELLGSRQHGQISAVGFDLYTRLLAQAVNDLGGMPNETSKGMNEALTYLTPLSEGIQLNLPIPAYVPENYLPEEKIRLRLYRRLAGLTTLSEIEDMSKELEDRFGEMPEPVANLLYQLKLKILAQEAKAKAVITESGQLVIKADSLEWIDRDGLQRRAKTITKMTPRQLWMSLHPDSEVWQAELEKVLRLIGRMVNDPGR
ncbi:transcription-repair coupling factor, partial [Anaerolineales bacterium HSG24]|nr:transcription-repair coupling factor [Anaerolineales bacterium HSG24]